MLSGLVITEGMDMSRLSSFSTGGRAEYYAEPRSVFDAVRALEMAYRKNLAVTVIGAGTHVLVSDDGIVCSVSETGVLTFTGECSVYAPYGGTVQSVAESGGVYMMEIEHTSSFSSVISGLTYAYLPAGSEVYATIPVGYSDGSHEVTVSMYDGGTLISAYTLGEENDIVWNV